MNIMGAGKMKICGKCGAKADDGVYFCPVCGAPFDVMSGAARKTVPVRRLRGAKRPKVRVKINRLG